MPGFGGAGCWQLFLCAMALSLHDDASFSVYLGGGLHCVGSWGYLEVHG